MNTVARLGCFFLLAILAAGSALAQSAAPAAPANGQIVLDVVVSPKSGAAEGGLQQQDFKVLDNGKPQAITSFQALKGRNASVEVVVVLDSVNTEIQTVEYARSELEKFLRAEGGRLAFPLSIAVVTDTDVQVLGDFSTDGNALAAQLNQDSPGLRAIRRSAGLQGAAERWELSLNALQKLAAAEAARRGRKIVIWLSPGWPLLARASAEFDSKQQQQVFTELVDISNDLAQARVTLYMIDPRGA